MEMPLRNAPSHLTLEMPLGNGPSFNCIEYLQLERARHGQAECIKIYRGIECNKPSILNYGIEIRHNNRKI